MAAVNRRKIGVVGMVLSPDQINGLFEALGAVFILRHCRAVWRVEFVLLPVT